MFYNHIILIDYFLHQQMFMHHRGGLGQRQGFFLEPKSFNLTDLIPDTDLLE